MGEIVAFIDSVVAALRCPGYDFTQRLIIISRG